MAAIVQMASAITPDFKGASPAHTTAVRHKAEDAKTESANMVGTEFSSGSGLGSFRGPTGLVAKVREIKKLGAGFCANPKSAIV